jgi:uncharacterized protein Yka (UPF0111/DUF47 family)
MIKNLLAKLLPREDKFYLLISQMSEQTRLGALHLKAFMESGTDQARHAEAKKAVRECKVAAKKLSTKVTEELCYSFITPFDREDIQDFTLSLYLIAKIIDKICTRMDLHGLGMEHGDFTRQTDLIVQEAYAMEDMVAELVKGHNNERIVQKVSILHDLENKGDELLGELLAKLFKEERSARDLILRKDIYDMLEKVIDRYRDAAAIALQIVLKHS